MKLAEWLKETGTTQAALARRLGISQGRVSQLVAGDAPSLELALKITEATGGAVTPADFVAGYGTGSMNPKGTTPGLDGVDEAVAAIRDGEMVVVIDDDDRENEGDLIASAALITPQQMAFMIRHTSGIICAPMTEKDARRLHLDPMVATNDAPLSTAFTVSVDYRRGLTTGISAAERTATVRALADPATRPEDFVRPGHVFPLVARPGGVLIRSGHTEAAVDLCRLAGLAPVGVISELVNDDGTVKRGADVVAFAREHGLKIIAVADLIAWRRTRERLVERLDTFELDTPAGPARAIAYATPFDPVQHLALVIGACDRDGATLVRLHRENVLEDVFGRRETLNAVFERFKAEGGGVLVYLREGATGVPPASLAEL
ncbi:MAG TPA: 3,4-dihydroxy-2-butanone-4-phosphate synthase, partial [Thermopetrobacter sp.]|nr:3,4-dihydroxy-2-butanone-4-phosphate synthase [Thermopetrobacter sp.]